MKVQLSTKGDWSKSMSFLNKIIGKNYLNILHRYGQLGVAALSSATPVDSGRTATSWGYKIEQSHGQTALTFTNSNVNKGVNIAIILQYGHGTGTGGYVQGRDYINPAIKPVFDKLVDDLWKEVNK